MIRTLVEWGISPLVLYYALLAIVLACMVILIKLLWRRVDDLPAPPGYFDDSVTELDWSQNASEVEVDFPLPTDGPTPKRSDIECKITTNRIFFGFYGDTAPMLEGTLWQPVLASECSWQFHPVGAKATHVRVTLVKADVGDKWESLMLEDAANKSQAPTTGRKGREGKKRQ